jgi:hypothetical protein
MRHLRLLKATPSTRRRFAGAHVGAIPALVLSSITMMSGAAGAQSSPTSFDRHDVMVLPFARPLGVPTSYVLTRHGFFHPSCVIKLSANESIDGDGVIRDLSGAFRERVPPCQYPRFNRKGLPVVSLPVTSRASAPTPTLPPDHPHAIDGWVTHYFYESVMFTFGTGLTISTTWKVPEVPTKLATQDIALFNGQQTYSDSSGMNVMQPVLEFNAAFGHWWIIAEYCCAPVDVQTQHMIVRVGDTIRGDIVGTSCAMGACQDWTTTATDVDTGQSVVLHKSGLPTVVDIIPGVLETSDITSCDMLPANGQTTFFSHQVLDGAGKPLFFPYVLAGLPINAPPELPRDCGWGGSSPAKDRFILTYGKMPFEGDGGPNGDGDVQPSVNDAGRIDAAVDRVADMAVSDTGTTPSTPRVDAGAPGANTPAAGCACEWQPIGGKTGAPLGGAWIAVGLLVLLARSRVRSGNDDGGRSICRAETGARWISIRRRR